MTNKIGFAGLTARRLKVFAIRQYQLYSRTLDAIKIKVRCMLGDEEEQHKEYARMVVRRWRKNNPDKVDTRRRGDPVKEAERQKRWRLSHRLQYNLFSMLWKRKMRADPVYREKIRTYDREYKRWIRAIAKQKAMEAQCECNANASKEQGNVQEH
jgi:hypothetical protein